MAKSTDVTAQPDTRTFEVEITPADRDALKAILPKLLDHTLKLRADICESPAQEDALDQAIGLLASFLPLEDYDALWDRTIADDHTLDTAHSIRSDILAIDERIERALSH